MTDPVNPPHYQFSNGAQTIDITENLTSNGGQAVQYIARATRLDGANKGDSVEDLRKALWFVLREVNRLTGYESLGDLPLEAVVGPDEPRVWNSALDIPAGTSVIANDGDTLHILPGGKGWWGPVPDHQEGWTLDRFTDSDFAPFTEVIEEPPVPDPVPRVWRTIADAPFNIQVLSHNGIVWSHSEVGWTPGWSRDFRSNNPNWRVDFGPWTEVL